MTVNQAQQLTAEELQEWLDTLYETYVTVHLSNDQVGDMTAAVRRLIRERDRLKQERDSYREKYLMCCIDVIGVEEQETA